MLPKNLIGKDVKHFPKPDSYKEGTMKRWQVILAGIFIVGIMTLVVLGFISKWYTFAFSDYVFFYIPSPIVYLKSTGGLGRSPFARL